MDTARLNITLPEDVSRMLRGVKNKSAYIAEAIREKKRLEEKRRLKEKLEAAYRQAAEEDYAEYKEFEGAIKDGLEDDAW